MTISGPAGKICHSRDRCERGVRPRAVLGRQGRVHAVYFSGANMAEIVDCVRKIGQFLASLGGGTAH